MFPSPPPWASLLSSPFCLLPSWQSQEAPGFHQAQTQRGRSWEGPEALALPETTQGPLLIHDLVAPKGTMARGFGRINILWMRGEACLPCFHPMTLGPPQGELGSMGEVLHRRGALGAVNASSLADIQATPILSSSSFLESTQV